MKNNILRLTLQQYSRLQYCCQQPIECEIRQTTGNGRCRRKKRPRGKKMIFNAKKNVAHSFHNKWRNTHILENKAGICNISFVVFCILHKSQSVADISKTQLHTESEKCFERHPYGAENLKNSYRSWINSIYFFVQHAHHMEYAFAQTFARFSLTQFQLDCKYLCILAPSQILLRTYRPTNIGREADGCE